jgi:hypothetical protein
MIDTIRKSIGIRLLRETKWVPPTKANAGNAPYTLSRTSQHSPVLEPAGFPPRYQIHDRHVYTGSPIVFDRHHFDGCGMNPPVANAFEPSEMRFAASPACTDCALIGRRSSAGKPSKVVYSGRIHS